MVPTSLPELPKPSRTSEKSQKPTFQTPGEMDREGPPERFGPMKEFWHRIRSGWFVQASRSFLNPPGPWEKAKKLLYRIRIVIEKLRNKSLSSLHTYIYIYMYIHIYTYMYTNSFKNMSKTSPKFHKQILKR